MSLDRNFSFYYMLILYGVQGTLTPSGTVAVDCGGQQTFTCDVLGITANSQAGWMIMRLVNITASGSNGVITATMNPRITGTGGNVPTSTITIADFTMSDNGGTVQCINTENGSDQGTATISVELLPPPSNATATTVGHDCAVITLQWDKPHDIVSSDITNTVSCTPSSTACGACTSSPCNITRLALNTDYNFTVGLNSGMCGTSMTTTAVRTMGLPQLLNVDTQLKTCTSVDITWKQQPATTPTTSVAVTYCPTSSPNCGTNTTCTINPCTIYGLAPNTTYDIIVFPNNNCGRGTAIAAIVTTPPGDSSYMETLPTSCLGLSVSSCSAPVGISVAVTFAVTSVVSSSLTAVIMYFVCIRKKRSGVVNDTGTGGDIYEDTSGNIKMDPSPAYQTVPSAIVQ